MMYLFVGLMSKLEDSILTKFLIVGVLPSSLVNFRGELIKAVRRNGNYVSVMASFAAVEEKKILNCYRIAALIIL